MKMIDFLRITKFKMTAATIICVILLLVGCTISWEPVGSGYYIKTVRGTLPLGGYPNCELSLYFQKPGGRRVLVWKNFTGEIVVNDSTALFVTTARAGEYLLFAVKDGVNPLEVGKAILAFQAEKEKADVPAFLEQHQIYTYTLKKLTDGFDLQYSKWRGNSNPFLHISLTWDDLSTIMQRVKAEGRPQKGRSGMSYLQIEYNAKREK